MANEEYLNVEKIKEQEVLPSRKKLDEEPFTPEPEPEPEPKQEEPFTPEPEPEQEN